MLQGVRIVELCTGLAAPVAGMMLAEMGADVVKVEPPGGDPGRSAPSFATWNRSKQSIVLDVEITADHRRLGELLADADVLIHDLPPSRARALELDDEALQRVYPQLISCSVLGYPAGHDDAERPTDDLLVQARNGILADQDGHREGPIVWRYPIGGWGASQMAAAGILTRLLMRLETGRGGGVHTSLLQGMLGPFALMWSRVESGELSFPMPKPDGVLHLSMYECSDGWIQIMDPTGKLDYAALPAMWEIMSETPVDVDDMAQRRAAFRKRPRDLWIAQLRARDIPVEPCVPLGELLRHSEAVANGYVVEVEDPQWGRTRQSATPMHFAGPVEVRSPAPRLNQHADRPWRSARSPTPAGGGGAKPLPLQDLKVVDFGAFLAGPMAPALLGDMGADVVKVEPLTGDRMRFMVRYFQICSRNKRSLAIDLYRPEAQEVLARLARWADVAHHNIRIRSAKKMGLDEEALRRHNPNLVFGYVSSYGLRGERANWPGYDSVFEALGGWEVENAGEGNAPIFTRAGCMDVLCALNSLVGTLAALYDREANGRVGGAESSLLGVATFTQSETLLKADGELAPFLRLDKNQTGVSPFSRIYEGRDGWVAVAAKPIQAQALCAAFGAEGVESLAAAALGFSQAELLARLAAQGVAAEPVLSENAMDACFDYPPHRESRIITAYRHPEDGLIEQPGAFWLFSDTQLRFDRPPPRLGEHTDEILAELGYSPEQIKALHAKGVVRGLEG